jgi:hypothetical protein
MAAARARAHSGRITIKLPVLDDLHGVQLGIMQVAEAIIHKEIDHRSAQLLLSLLRLAASDLKSDKGWHQKSELTAFGYEPRMIVENPNFESQYDLPEDFDLSIDPEVAFPPPVNPNDAGAPHIPAVGMCGSDDVPPFEEFEWGDKMAKSLREAASAAPSLVTPDEVEVYDLLEREGQPGVDKCLARRERSRKRRERQARRRYYEQVARNQSIKQAAEWLAEQQRRAQAANPQPQAGTKKSFGEQWDELSQSLAERKPPQGEAIEAAKQGAAKSSGSGT